MEDIRLFEGELYIMEFLWVNKELEAKVIAKLIKEYIGWEKNTTYTVIKRLIDKGAIERIEPGFICRAKISKKSVQKTETQVLLDKVYDGKLVRFFTDYLADVRLNQEEIVALKRILNTK